MFRKAEELLASLTLGVMVVLPLTHAVLREAFGGGVPGSIPIVRHLTLWICFLGASMAAREGRLLSLATGKLIPEGRMRDAAHAFSSAVAAAVAALLCRAAIDLVIVERESGTMVTAGFPAWIAQLVLPLSFALIALRLVWRAGEKWNVRGAASLGLVAGLVAGHYFEILEGWPAWPGLLLLLLATVLGGPIL